MKASEQLLWKQTDVPFTELNAISEKIVSELRKHEFFCLWLIGDIGAGKTTITGSILRKLGLAPDAPVSSPTFTYLSDYKLNKKTYGHLDFYRLDSGAHPISDLLSYLDYDGLFVEWPENLGSNSAAIIPTHILRIEKGTDMACRNYSFSGIS